jgi:ThiF family
VGLAGLGGGGSHIVQQLAHIGFQRFVVYDGDVVEESNLNRLVGATSIDVPAETPKLYIGITSISLPVLTFQGVTSVLLFLSRCSHESIWQQEGLT